MYPPDVRHGGAAVQPTTSVPPTPPRGPRPASDLTRALALAARRWHAQPEEAALAESVLDDVLTFLPPRGCAAVTLLDFDGGTVPRTAGTTGVAIDLDALQHRLHQGPVVDALEGSVVASADLGAEPRWPLVVPEALGRGIRSLLCVPLDTGRQVVGVLSVYCASPSDGGRLDRGLLDAIATHAALAVQQVQQVVQLTAALVNRDVVGQAKGMLMERYGLTADAAFGLLVRAAQDTHRAVRDVAARLTVTGEAPEPPPGLLPMP
jgi:GAF domain-containing protein